jgi:hypothetical protein
MAGDYIPAADGAFDAWQDNFVTYVSANAAALGLNPGVDIPPLSAAERSRDQEIERAPPAEPRPPRERALWYRLPAGSAPPRTGSIGARAGATGSIGVPPVQRGASASRRCNGEHRRPRRCNGEHRRPRRCEWGEPQRHREHREEEHREEKETTDEHRCTQIRKRRAAFICVHLCASVVHSSPPRPRPCRTPDNAPATPAGRTRSFGRSRLAGGAPRGAIVSELQTTAVRRAALPPLRSPSTAPTAP